MAITNKVFIDNLHKQLYVTSFQHDNSLVAPASMKLYFSLDDFTDLSGQSTWYVRSIKFRMQAFSTLNEFTDANILSVQTGIVDSSLTGSSFTDLEDFQPLNAFPLKNGNARVLTRNDGTPNNRGTWQFTYKPSEHLTLNREQLIWMTIQNVSGTDVNALGTIYLHAERGD